MKRFFALILFSCFLFSVFSLSIFAHPGRTDANGGHWNHSTGEYHYHGTPSNSSNSNPTGNTTNQHWDDPDDSGEIIVWIILAICALPFAWAFFSFIVEKIKRLFFSSSSTSPPPQIRIEPKQDEKPSVVQRTSTIDNLSAPSHTQHTQPSSHTFTPSASPTSPPPKKATPPISSAATKTNITLSNRSLPFASGIIAEHPVILDADPDYLTEAQVLAYALSIETPRGKKAVTEQFVIKGDLTTNETTKPFQASANVMSLGSAQQYHTTLVRCSCPDHRARHLPCKHMIALAINVNAITVDIEALQKREERS